MERRDGVSHEPVTPQPSGVAVSELVGYTGALDADVLKSPREDLAVLLFIPIRARATVWTAQR